MPTASQLAPRLRLHTTLPLPAKIQQIDGLQVLRAAAVFLVAWLHAGNDIDSRLPDLGMFGVDIFFVISGFILSRVVLNSNWRPGLGASRQFLLRRVIRIYPIYWFFATITLARMAHAHVPALSTYLPSLTLLPLPHAPPIIFFTWTLLFEVFFYAVMAIALLWTVRHAAWMVIGLVTAAGIVGSICHLHSDTLLVLCNPILVEFAFGAILALIFQRFGRRRAAGIALLVIGVAATLCLRAWPPPAANGMDEVLAGQQVVQRSLTWGVAAALLTAGTVFWFPQIKGRIGRLLVVLGNSSYSAYLASLLVLEFSLRGILRIFPSPSAPEAWSIGRMFTVQLTDVAAVLFVGWLSYQFVEWPMVRALQRSLATPQPS